MIPQPARCSLYWEICFQVSLLQTSRAVWGQSLRMTSTCSPSIKQPELHLFPQEIYPPKILQIMSWSGDLRRTPVNQKNFFLTLIGGQLQWSIKKQELPCSCAFLSANISTIYEICYTGNHSPPFLILGCNYLPILRSRQHTLLPCSSPCFPERGTYKQPFPCHWGPIRAILNAKDFSLLWNKGFCANTSEFARLLESPIPISWDPCVFYHLRSANPTHLKLAGACTAACWHPPPKGATWNSVRRQAGFNTASLVKGHALRVTFGPQSFTLTAQLDLFCHPSTLLLVVSTCVVSPAKEHLAFGFTGDQKFSACPGCSALSSKYWEKINLLQPSCKQNPF